MNRKVFFVIAIIVGCLGATDSFATESKNVNEVAVYSGKLGSIRPGQFYPDFGWTQGSYLIQKNGSWTLLISGKSLSSDSTFCNNLEQRANEMLASYRSSNVEEGRSITVIGRTQYCNGVPVLVATQF